MIRLVQALAAGLLAGLLAGCSLVPEYRRPELPVAEAFPEGKSHQVEAAAGGISVDSVAGLGWRDYFTDPRLQQLIATALTNNRDLRETVLNQEAFRAQYRIRRSALYPEVRVEGVGRKQDGFSDNDRTSSESYSLEAGITAYELDLFGRLRSLQAAALEEYLAAESTSKAAAISLVADVAVAYFTWQTDRQLLQISEETRRIEEESYQLIALRAAAGIATELDLAQASTSLETVKANLALFRRQVAQDVHFLGFLTGSALPQALLGDPAPAGELPGLAELPVPLHSTVLLDRPDIIAAEHQLRGANANIGAARAAFFPSIRLTTTAGVVSTELGELFASGSGAWLFSPAISLPIFTAGRLQAELAVAEISKDILIARYERAIQAAFREVSDSLIGESTYRAQLQALQANLEANEQYYSLARERYQQGVDSFLVLLDAQRSLYSSRQNYVASRLARQVNQVALYRALGGGWRERTAKR